MDGRSVINGRRRASEEGKFRGKTETRGACSSDERVQRENENCQSGLTLPVGSIVHYVSREILAIIQTNVPLVRANLLGHSQSRPTNISLVNAVKPSTLKRYSPSFLLYEHYKFEISFVYIFRVWFAKKIGRKSCRITHRLELIFIARRVPLTMFTIERLIAKRNVIVRLIIVTQCRSFD